MKKLIALLAIILFGFVGHSQITYPKFETDSSGKKLVVMTIEQAQALDNQTDLLVLFEKLNGEIGQYDSVCLQLVNEKDSVISSQTLQLSNFKKDLAKKNEIIVNLDSTNQRNIESISTYKVQLELKNQEIALHKKEIKRVKKKAYLGGGIAGTILGLVIALLIK